MGEACKGQRAVYEDVQGQLRGVAQLSAVLQTDRSPQEHGSKEGEAG